MSPSGDMFGSSLSKWTRPILIGRSGTCHFSRRFHADCGPGGGRQAQVCWSLLAFGGHAVWGFEVEFARVLTPWVAATSRLLDFFRRLWPRPPVCSSSHAVSGHDIQFARIITPFVASKSSLLEFACRLWPGRGVPGPGLLEFARVWWLCKARFARVWDPEA